MRAKVGMKAALNKSRTVVTARDDARRGLHATVVSLDAPVADEESSTLLDMLSGREEHTENGPDLARAVGNLPERLQSIVREHFYEGWSLEAIAERRGIHSNTVIRHKGQAIDMLRDALGAA